MDKIDLKLVEAVVLLNRQFLLIEHLVKGGDSSLVGMEEAMDEGRQGLDEVLGVYNYVFSLVDHLIRFQKISFALPRLNHRSKPFLELNVALAGLKDVRNQLQHINNDIENEFSGPLLGAICWSSRKEFQYVVTFHDIGRKRESPLAGYSCVTDQFDGGLRYIYNGSLFDLTAAIAGVRKFSEYIERAVDIQIDRARYDPRKHYAALQIHLKPLDS